MSQDTAEAPRLRLLAAGKTLFARLGYEQASTSAIAREAGTSESQLVRHFDGKRGLLGAIFDESWRSLNLRIDETIDASKDAASSLEAVLGTIIGAFARDAELAYLFLFEGRRIHAGERDIVMSAGYFEFVGRLQRLVRRAKGEGVVAKELDSNAFCSALIGAAEGMIRDRLIAQRAGRRPPFSERQIRTIFAAMLRRASETPPRS